MAQLQGGPASAGRPLRRSASTVVKATFSIRAVAPNFPVVGNGHVLVLDPITGQWEYPEAWHYHAVRRVKWIPSR